MSDWRTALVSVAQKWTDPDHPVRADAVAQTLAADNRFTAESIAFAVNHAADLIASGGAAEWLEPAPAVSAGSLKVGVVSRGRTPLEGFFESIAALASGFTTLIAASAASPALIEAFLREVGGAAGEDRFSVTSESRLFATADAVVARGTGDDVLAWRSAADQNGISDNRLLLRAAGIGVAVIDGDEDRSERSGLAEDILLHEGGTPFSVRLLFAPAGLEPDPMLEALAGFREVYPEHPATDGSLSMQTAFLGAASAPHAVGPGFLVSKGEPEAQSGAHLRWAPYDNEPEVSRWLNEQRSEIAFVVARPQVHDQLSRAGLIADLPRIGPGDAHRPVPGQLPLTPDLPAFLRTLRD